MTRAILLTVVISMAFNVGAQTIVFADPCLKDFLITQNCVDLNNDLTPDADVDLNDDNEIQIAEALAVSNLVLHPQSGNCIKSIEDLGSFTKLDTLWITNPDSVSQIASLGLDSLTVFKINGGLLLKHIDISDLPLVDDVRVENMNEVLEYLNVQNGNAASYFSLFYTFNILEACVDSIATEYNKVQTAMIQSASPSLVCTVGVGTNLPQQMDVALYPNPSNGTITVRAPAPATGSFKIVDPRGRLIFTGQLNQQHSIDTPTGVYFVMVSLGSQTLYRKLVLTR